MSQTYTVTVYPDRTVWCKHNTTTLHRLDGPAVEYKDGGKYWYKEWWMNGKRHRLDGPAVEFNDGNKYWYFEGKRHRLDGPAIEYCNGTKEWWVNGKHLTAAEFKDLTKPKAVTPTCDGKTVEIEGKKYVLKLVP